MQAPVLVQEQVQEDLVYFLDNLQPHLQDNLLRLKQVLQQAPRPLVKAVRLEVILHSQD